MNIGLRVEFECLDPLLNRDLRDSEIRSIEEEVKNFGNGIRTYREKGQLFLEGKEQEVERFCKYRIEKNGGVNFFGMCLVNEEKGIVYKDKEI